MRVVHTKVFAVNGTGGNPCPVVIGAESLMDSERLRVARHFGLDTVFIEPSSAAGAAMKLRYFVPDHEMGVSGHASIAAITVAARSGLINGARVRIETINGKFDAYCDGVGDDLFVTLEQREADFMSQLHAVDVASVLGIPRSHVVDDRAMPIQVVSVSRPKLLVPIASTQVLNALQPDFAELWATCEAHKASGIYAFARPSKLRGCDAEARQFPLRAGFVEDAATGVAAAALAAYLVRYDRLLQSGTHTLRIAQGYAMGSPSQIDAIVQCRGGAITRTAIKGHADVVETEDLAI